MQAVQLFTRIRHLFSDRVWFWLGLFSLLVFSLTLRFWRLERFDTFVFDEVHFANFAHNYLQREPFFDAHPPLGKYFIALGIWLGGFNSFGYRWMNALVGAFVPIVMAAIVYQASGRRSWAFLTGLLAALDGLLLVESRYALLNIYLVMMGLLGHLGLLMAIKKTGGRRWLWLAIGSIFLGAAAGVKWSGLSFTIALLGTWFCVYLDSRLLITEGSNSPLAKLATIKLYQLFIFLPVVMGLTYYLIWQPHLKQNPDAGLREVQQQMLAFHKSYANRPQEHPYCASWYTWPFMVRPVCYFYQTTTEFYHDPPIAEKSPPLAESNFVYDVHALGNPILYWLIVIAILSIYVLLAQYLYRLIYCLYYRIEHNYNQAALYPMLYVAISYSVNLFSWAGVSKFTFIYHYLPASTFGMMAAAWWLEELRTSDSPALRVLAWLILTLIIAAFIFWLPIYLGIPLTPESFMRRMWLPSWV